MANAAQFIGSKISLISKSEIRYEGILYSLNVVEATISLAKVKSFGTEGRDTERPVPPKDEIYEFIIFRGSDIKGIDVVEPPKPTPIVNDGLPNDPAIVEVSQYHSPARPPPQHSNIGPVPVQVQASSAYNAMSGTSYGSSGYGGSSSSTTAPLPKPVASNQPTRISTMSSALLDDLPEPSIKFEANDFSGSNASTPAFNASNQKPERESQAKLPYGRGSARGGQGHGFHRVGDERPRDEERPRGDERPRDEERPRGGRGGGRGYGGGNRGRPYGSESADGQDAVGYQRRHGQEGGYQRQQAIGQQRQQGQDAVGHQRQQRQEPTGGQQRQGQEATGNQRQTEDDGAGEHRQQGQGYPRRSSGGGGGNYNNNLSRGGGGGGYRGGRGGYRPNRTQGILRAPQSAKVTFDSEFDFEKANEELQTAIKNLKLTEKENELAAAESNGSSDQAHHHETEEQENKEPQTCYKKDDFFDSISCEALEREKGASNRPDWKAERKLNAETFGLTGRGRGGGGYYRGGGRGYYNNRGGGGYGYGYGGGYGGHRGGNRGGYDSGYNNRYNNGGRRGRGASNSNPEGTTTQGSGSF